MKRFFACVLILATSFCLGSCFREPTATPSATTGAPEIPNISAYLPDAKSAVEPQGLCGAWVSTVANIDFPSAPSLSAEELKKEIDGIVSNAEDYGLNALFLQVRPCADAIYPSEIFPTSAYVCGKQGGELPLDVLEYFIGAAHAKNIAVHAWINPYRVTCASASGYGEETLAPSSPAVTHPEWVVRHSWTENGTRKYALFFDPALPEVRKLICDGVEELIENYGIDGIHFDYIRYPEQADNFPDKDIPPMVRK